MNIAIDIKKKSLNEIRDFIFENYYKRIEFSKGNSYFSLKRKNKKDLLFLASKFTEKIPNSHNAKEHYQSFLWKKNRKSVKQSNVITYQPKTLENPNIVDIKSVTTERPETLHKLSKTIRQAEKVGSNSNAKQNVKTF